MAHELFSKNPAKVSAKQIIQLAKICRQTFYNHHNNVVDALNDTNKEMIKQFEELLHDVNNKYISNRQFYLCLIRFIYHNKEKVLNQDDCFNRMLLYELLSSLKPQLNLMYPNYGKAFTELADWIYKEHISAILFYWMKCERCNPDQMNACVCSIDRAVQIIPRYILYIAGR